MTGVTYPFTCPNLSALDAGYTDPWKQDSLIYLNEPQIGEMVYPTALHSQLQSDPVQGIDGGGGIVTTHSESLLPPLTFLGCEGVQPAWVEDAANTQFDIVETTVSLQPASRRPAGTRDAPERSYFCDICCKHYSQPQGLSRHRQAVHNNPSSCLHCDFKWSRPYKYRAHLVKCHSDVDHDYILGKPAGSRRCSAIIGRDVPQHVSLPAIEPGQQTQAEPQQRPLTPPAVANVRHVPSPSMSPVVYDHQPVYDGTVITTRRHEDASGSAFLGVTDYPSSSTFSSTVEHSQLANDVGISVQRGISWLPPTSPGGFMATDRAFSPATALSRFSPTPIPPIGRYCDSPVFGDSMVETSGSMHSYPFSATGDDYLDFTSTSCG